MSKLHLIKTLGLVLVENNRSRAYLQRMIFNGLKPGFVLILKSVDGIQQAGQRPIGSGLVSDPMIEKDGFYIRENETLEDTINRNSIEHFQILTTDINCDEVIEFLKGRPEEVFVPSVAGGVILGKKILGIGKKFLHIHPGLVPSYRGSTTIYYSLLRENKVGASAIFMSPRIDEGDVLDRKEFSPPEDRTQIDYLYDPLVRSDLLVTILNNYVKYPVWTTCAQAASKDPVYYIIHPVLKHLAILGAVCRR